MKTLVRLFGLMGLVFALGWPALSAHADSIASRIEQQGEMTYLKITDLRAIRRNGLLNVQAEVTNTDSSNERLFYRFKWLDDAGFSVWDDEPWKPLLIYGKQKQLITVAAPTPQATDFRLVLQSPHNKANDDSSPSTAWPNE